MTSNGVTATSAPSSTSSTSSTSTTTAGSSVSSRATVAQSLSPRPGVVGSAVKRRDYSWRLYTAAEVAEHQSSDSMWIIIHGKVYDVHAFLEDHPGGPEILTQHAGKDATADFEETFHSDAARVQLKDYVIGALEGFTGADDAATAGRKRTQAAAAAAGTGGLKTSGGAGGISPMLIVAGGITLLAVAAYLVLPHLSSH